MPWIQAQAKTYHPEAYEHQTVKTVSKQQLVSNMQQT